MCLLGALAVWASVPPTAAQGPCPLPGPSAPRRATGSLVTEGSQIWVRRKRPSCFTPEHSSALPWGLHLLCHGCLGDACPTVGHLIASLSLEWPCSDAASPRNDQTESSRPHLDLYLAAFHFNVLGPQSGHVEHAPTGRQAVVLCAPGCHCCLWGWAPGTRGWEQTWNLLCASYTAAAALLPPDARSRLWGCPARPALLSDRDAGGRPCSLGGPMPPLRACCLHLLLLPKESVDKVYS